ncbi:aromatic ring-hydroxylating dioxygenase subunit alpha [Paracraurococcus lichenis]|uniref:Aromatic ring-hydroxylating dioxygenase subunit alpha n=1 Tax=Paracraurococcus lichenis TaxID=3064888 RepID=A0ABT9E6K4_9PROT|nr:aromatic ring-hydroxylating dioxygenase subunit alpha [Paracraurococcus sp. LOR1-02]MDO9711615.1 aromatic ring-hydroxylating dioxygenase subunit alpha [Paracraurococcus sp. LOR1-02]
MMSAEQNRRLTQVGPGMPGGALLRHYWQPVALAEELEGPRPVRPVRLLGQDLVLFRDEQGRVGLLDRDCPHRNADLAFGRLEDGGLRCPFHGWLFDVAGTCLDTPAEPEGSRLCDRIRQKAHPVEERGGILWAFLGEGAPPAFPALDCFAAPATHVFAFKGLIECNWLQALEVGIDPAHASFLHRFFEDEDASQSYGKQFRAASADSDMPMTRVLREFPRPRIEVEPAPHGLRITALRRLSDAHTHVRVTNLVFPQAFAIPLSAEMTITQWHVPVDDGSCYWFAIFTSFAAPVDKARMREQRLALYELPDYRPKVGRHNAYGFDAEEQRRRTYTGMGEDINVHDQWAVESQGRIQDRTREHLASSDKAIAANRRLLFRAMDAVERGETPLMALDAAAAPGVTGPATMDGIGPTEGWEQYWPEVDRRRRQGAPWARLAAE